MTGSTTRDWFTAAQGEVWELAYRRYQEALDKGIAKECAVFCYRSYPNSTLHDRNCAVGFIILNSAPAGTNSNTCRLPRAVSGFLS